MTVRRWVVRVAAAAVLGGTLAATGIPAALAGGGLAASASPTPSAPSSGRSSGATDPANGPGHDEQEPSAEEVATEQRRAEALLREVEDRADEVTRARAALDRASAAAGLALEKYTGAVVAARTAALEADRQEQLLLQAQLTLAGQKALLGRWAREAYGEGDLLGNPALITLLDGGSTDDLGRAITYLGRVGNSKSRAVEGYAEALRAQAATASAARGAQVEARDAQESAEAARAVADAAVRQQRTELAALESRLSSAQDAAVAAELRAKNLAAARAIARSRTNDTRGANVVTGEVGDCAGGDVSGYPNGRIPVSVLCPLWGTANHHLRADAAFAFNRLSQAYAQRFGEPVCITDSYRDYDTQVLLYATKPTLAAVPGTSNHGWGTATDLCGGIEDFGTDTHDWMLVHAPQYGWFHPAWAEPGGSRPEPWHWEFAG